MLLILVFFNFLQVKEDENVTVGHVIAIIDDSGEASASTPPAAAAEQAPPSPPSEEKTSPAPAASSAPHAAAAAAVSDDGHERGRVPSIHFPPRRTATGDIISMLPAAEAAAAAAGAASASSSSSSSSSESKPVRMTESPQKSQLFIRLPPRPSGPAPPPRKELSDWEIENIMLGGAEMELK